MVFFSRKQKILETPIFESFKDYHSHILPGVDDGVRTLDESLEILAYFEKHKVAEVVLTPHAMVGVNESGEAIESAFEQLSQAYNGPISLSLASEYMLDTSFVAHLNGGKLRKINSDSILVETSYLSAPRNIDELLYNICTEGITPMIAHPERYSYMKMEEYHELKERDYSFQLNIISLTGAYGTTAQKKAFYLLEKGMYDIMGSDIHNLKSFESRISNLKLSKKHIDMLLQLK